VDSLRLIHPTASFFYFCASRSKVLETQAFKLCPVFLAAAKTRRCTSGGMRTTNRPEIGFIRFFAALFAEGKVVLNRILKCLTQFLDGCALERNHIAGINHFSMKDAGFIIELNIG